MSFTHIGLLLSVYVACFVEMVEAATIVMAMGFTRNWRSTIFGVMTGLGLLAVITAAFGYALVRWLPESALQLVIGGLLLVFGLQWLRKAILRSAGRKSMRNEAAAYREEVRAAKAATAAGSGLDSFAFVVAMKGIFLEGMEAVFIVITFGANTKQIPLASLAALVAVVTVLAIALLVRKPLAMIPENLMKYAVGLLLTTFGTFWVTEGLGIFRATHHSFSWPGSDMAVLVLIAVWYALSRLCIGLLKPVEKVQ